MSNPGLISPFPFLPAMPLPYHYNAISSSPNLIHFPANSQPMAVAGLSSLPFMNSCDIASQLLSPMAFNFVGDIDSMNGEKLFGENNLSLRIIMSGKEVGSIIGKRGDNIKKFREESMARINISDGNSPERIVTISGSCDQIHHAVELMCKKLDEDSVKVSEKMPDPNAPVLSMRLLIQPVQYTSIIGNGGGRISPLKEINNATMLLGIDFLPHSSERLLTISGSPESIASCILEICRILIEIPSSTYVVPYSPKSLPYSSLPQSIIANGNTKMTSPTFNDRAPVSPGSILPLPNIYPQSFFSDQVPYPMGLPMSLVPLKMPNPLPPYLNKVPYNSMWKSSSNAAQLQHPNISKEFFIENEMIGCIIGRGGSTINEIRAMSGAQIKISNCEDGKQDRRITIFGPFDAVQTALLLINSSLELHKQYVRINAASNTNTPIIFTNPSLPPNFPITSSDHQMPIEREQSSQLAELSEYDIHGHFVTKMKSNQVHLDGTKSVSASKYKPY